MNRSKKQLSTLPLMTKQDTSRLKEAFCRCLCERIRNSNTRTFVAHKLFSENKMHDYMANEPALKSFLSGGDNFYRLVNSICTDLVMDGILEFTENPDHGGREYSATTNLIRLCQRLQKS